MPQYPFQATETFGQDRLVAGLTQLASETVVLTAGIVYRRGMVLGRAANNKMVLSTAAATDGSQVP